MDPYRVPPVTGPDTRAQKLRAKLELLGECRGWRVAHRIVTTPLVLSFVFSCAAFVTIALCCEPRPQPTWLIECPDREPWVSPHITTNGGRITARDPDDRRIILPENYAATEIEQ